MNRLPVLCVTLMTVIGFNVIQSSYTFAAPQEAQPADVLKSKGEVPSKEETPELYLVTVAQYSLKEISVSQLTSNGIAAAIKAQEASPVEAIVLSATEGDKARASFGRTASVTMGKSIGRGQVVSRNTKRRDLGTVLNVTLMPAGDKVKAQLSFTSSRNTGKATDDSPPSLATTAVEGIQTFELGKPTLVSASTSGESNYVLVTITRR